MARPRLPIDPEQVRKMAQIGCTMKGMALVLDCSVDTLERHFAELISKARETGKTAIRQKQMEVALGGNVSMLIWLGKNILDQSDFPSTEAKDQTELTKDDLCKRANLVLKALA